MLRSLSSRSRRSCIARSCDRAEWIGRARATSTNSNVVGGACDRVECLSIKGLLHPLESRGQALAALTVATTTRNGRSDFVVSPTRVLLGRKKGASSSTRSHECYRTARVFLSFRLHADAARSVDDGDGPAVLGIGFLGGADHRRALLSVADRRDPGCGNPRCDEHVFCRLGAALAEREIVFAGTPLVAVTLDRYRNIRVTPQPIGLPA